MNRENLLRVADAIEKREVEWLGFNMIDWVDCHLLDMSGHDCGTTACVAGWAFVVSQGISNPKDALARFGDACDAATVWLDLTCRQEQDLFYHFPDRPVTPAMAVRTLRHAADHGVVDWHAANPEVRS